MLTSKSSRRLRMPSRSSAPAASRSPAASARGREHALVLAQHVAHASRSTAASSPRSSAAKIGDAEIAQRARAGRREPRPARGLKAPPALGDAIAVAAASEPARARRVRDQQASRAAGAARSDASALRQSIRSAWSRRPSALRERIHHAAGDADEAALGAVRDRARGRGVEAEPGGVERADQRDAERGGAREPGPTGTSLATARSAPGTPCPRSRSACTTPCA